MMCWWNQRNGYNDSPHTRALWLYQSTQKGFFSPQHSLYCAASTNALTPRAGWSTGSRNQRVTRVAAHAYKSAHVRPENSIQSNIHIMGFRVPAQNPTKFTHPYKAAPLRTQPSVTEVALVTNDYLQGAAFQSRDTLSKSFCTGRLSNGSITHQ